MESQEYERERELRLTTEQQAEIGDILLSARAVSRQMVSQARQQSDEILSNARKEAERIVREAEERADAIIREAEERASRPAVVREMQEYVVRCVDECFSKLRKQQLEAVDLINEQWRAFLSDLPLSGETPAAPPPEDGEVSREDIEDRVSAIAREIRDMNEE